MPTPNRRKGRKTQCETMPIEINSDGEWMQAWEFVERDNLSEAEREALIAEAGYLPNGAQAVLAAWPTE